MNNVVSLDENRKKDFKKFISDNKTKIYANTPKVDSISLDDEWVSETEWDELFHELSTREN